MPHLFDSLTLRSVTARNRIFVAPMCTYSAQDGIAQPWHQVHLGGLALGGAGLVMVEATAVLPEGRISPQDLGLWNDTQAAALAPIAAFMRDHGAVPCIQLAHAGRKAGCAAPWHGGLPLALADGGWQTVAPSALPFDTYPTPRALDSAELDGIVEAFATAARRAAAAGFQAVEIHMAHGYLLHQFLSPLSNQRQDDCGGSQAARMRLPLRVAEAVRAAFPADLPVLVRISATDWKAGGWDLDASIALCHALRALGIDFIDVSTAGLVHDQEVVAAPGFQVPFATAIRRAVGLPTGAVGLITAPEQAAQIVANSEADVVLLGRELLRDPHWPLRAAKALGVEGPWPNPYLRGRV